MDRKKIIQRLFDLSEICVGQEIRLSREDISALKYAVDSLKTDETYDLMHEDSKEIVKRSDVIKILLSNWQKYPFADDAMQFSIDDIRQL